MNYAIESRRLCGWPHGYGDAVDPTCVNCMNISAALLAAHNAGKVEAYESAAVVCSAMARETKYAHQARSYDSCANYIRGEAAALIALRSKADGGGSCENRA